MLFDLHGLESGPFLLLHISLALASIALLAPDFLQRRWTQILLIMVAAAAAGFGRIVTNVIPSVQPITPFIFIVGALVGGRRASSCAIVATLISNLELGMGVWTLHQVMARSVIGYVGAAARPYLMKANRLSLWRTAVVASLLAYPFGWIVSLPALEYGILKYVGYLWNGLLFDTYHAIGNGLFITALVPITNALLNHEPRHITAIESSEVAMVQ